MKPGRVLGVSTSSEDIGMASMKVVVQYEGTTEEIETRAEVLAVHDPVEIRRVDSREPVDDSGWELTEDVAELHVPKAMYARAALNRVTAAGGLRLFVEDLDGSRPEHSAGWAFVIPADVIERLIGPLDDEIGKFPEVLLDDESGKFPEVREE